MSVNLGYQTYKSEHLNRKELYSTAYKFVEDLAKTNFRWFEIDMNGFTYLVEIQPCGTLWKLVFINKSKTQITLEHLSQLAVIHGTAIEEEQFINAYTKAINTICNSNAAQ